MIMRLLLPVFLLTQLVLGYDHSINLTQCGEDTACFIRESCLRPSCDKDGLREMSKDKLAHYQPRYQQFDILAKANYCDVVIQMKTLSRNKFHVMMQVETRGGAKLRYENGIKFYQGGLQFHCNSEGSAGRYGLEIKNEGTKQEFDDDRMFCSISVKVLDQAALQMLNHDLNHKPKLVYSSNGNPEETLTFEDYSEEMYRKMRLFKCDTDLVSSSSDDASSVLLREINTLLPPYTCTTGKLTVKRDTGTQEEALEVFCDKNKWKKKVADTNVAASEITGKFSVYCSEKVCRKCDAAPPPLTCTNCKSPTFDAPKNADDCSILSCPNNKWTVTGSRIIEGEATCNRSSADPTKFAWFVQGTELSVAACMEKIDCGARFHDTPRYPIVPDSCPDGHDCKIVGLGTNKLSCKAGYSLKLTPSGTAPIDVVECNTTTGLFAGAAAVECIPNGEANRVCREWDA